jgi:VIT1/CCC1 family predicted Fe2+/Mn2+ transporter
VGSPRQQSIRVLDPIERIAEVLFGLIMVLTFTCSLSVAEAGRAEVRTMLVGALGCNLAWGVIDAVLYLMGALAERSRNLGVYRAVRDAAAPIEADRVIADALPAVVVSALDARDFERIRERVRRLPAPPAGAHLHAEDRVGALGVFLLVFLSVVPVAIPFVLIAEPQTALRASNAIAIGMLFLAGAAYGRTLGRSPWRVGAGMVMLGLVLVSLTIALGG